MVTEDNTAQRSYFSMFHLESAHQQSDFAAAIERSALAEKAPVRYSNHVSAVINSVVASWAFLESAVNEFFADAADGEGFYAEDLEPSRRARLASIVSTGAIRRMAVLQKYQLGLAQCDLEGFNEGTSPFQDARLLGRLRNSLVHYEPETIWGDEEHRLEKQLRGHFPENALAGGQGAFFPHRLLGVGCAEWSLRAAQDVADEFFRRVGIVSVYRR